MHRALLSIFAWCGVTVALIMDASKHRSLQEDKCLVWHSQHKSAGASIEEQLVARPFANSGIEREEWSACHSCRFVCDAISWNCGKQTCEEPADYSPHKNYKLAIRGYVQVLAGSPKWGRAGDGKCVWATMSREPTSRLVSAYLYCKNVSPGDPLCGVHRMNPANATLRQFAEHWGNYLFRELLWFPELRAQAESRPDFKSTLYCVTNRRNRSVHDEDHPDWQDPWVQYKDQLNGGDTLETRSGQLNYEAVKNALLARRGATALYDVIGVVEELEDSLRLFENFMPLKDSPWVEALGGNTIETHGSDRYADEKSQVLNEALADPVVQKAIAADVDLYHHVILPAFHGELKKYHIK